MKIEKKNRNKQCENLNNKKYVNPYKYDFIFRVGECVCVCGCFFLLFTKKVPRGRCNGGLILDFNTCIFPCYDE